mmetsp:Transcript_1211/g.2447  ORF Transcript_1211/g.2447 Transcript_1211/m.2447 type:complete len:368 (+) Transcript_1211:1584-2687(+)
MRFLKLIKQHDLVRPSSHRFRELPARIVPNITRRRADQTRHRVPLGVLAHVNPHHRGVVVEQKLGNRLAQRRLAAPRRPQKHKRAHGPPMGVQPRSREPNRVAHRTNRVVLPDHLTSQLRLHPQQLLLLARLQTRHGDARRSGNHRQHRIIRNRLRHQRSSFSATSVLLISFFLSRNQLVILLEFLLQLRNVSIRELRRPCQIASPLHNHELLSRLLQLFLIRLGRSQRRSLPLPPPRNHAPPPLQLLHLRRTFLQPLPRPVIRLLTQRALLNLQRHQRSIHIIKRLRLRFLLHLEPTRRLVDHIDRTVRQSSFRHVPVRIHRSSNQRTIQDPHAVMQLVAVLQPAQNADRGFHRRLRHKHRLEPAR